MLKLKQLVLKRVQARKYSNEGSKMKVLSLLRTLKHQIYVQQRRFGKILFPVPDGGNA